MNTAAEKDQKCPHCGLIHATTCPRIKVIEYGEDGRIRRIEFHPQGAMGFGDMGGKSIFDHVFGSRS